MDSTSPDGNLHRDLPEPRPAESVEVLASGPAFRVERIVSRGHRSEDGFWYDQSEHEWVLLVAGAAIVAWEDGRTVRLGPGDWVDIPPHVRHRVEWTDPDRETIWLAVFGPAD